MKTLVVDDDRVLADVIAFTLRREGCEVIKAYDGASGLQRWESDHPDLVILDVNMPKMDGFEVCRRIREKGDTPIILLTVRGEEDDIVHGLEIGADDYIVKPFSPRQLVARYKAIMRRAGDTEPPAVLQIGGLVFEPDKRRVKVLARGLEVSLTPLENRLLRSLLVNAGQVLTYDTIIDNVDTQPRLNRSFLTTEFFVHASRVLLWLSIGTISFVGLLRGFVTAGDFAE
ncbi:MAG: response regulator transcription factor, partial [Anaerolineales bacterium]